jgi:hypothetical protein
MKAQPTCGTKTLRGQKFSLSRHRSLFPSFLPTPSSPPIHRGSLLFPKSPATQSHSLPLKLPPNPTSRSLPLPPNPTSRAQAKPYPQPSADLRCTSRAGLSLIPPPCCTSGLRPRCGLPSSVPSLLPPGTGCHPALQPVYSRSPVVRTTAGHQQVRPLPPQGRVALLLPPQGQVAL